MSRVFLTLCSLSLQASVIVLVALALRLILRRAPRFIHCLLWGVVGLRLLFPFSFESIFSLMPREAQIPVSMGTSDALLPSGSSPIVGFPSVGGTVGDAPIISGSIGVGVTDAPTVTASGDALATFLEIAAIIWLIGMMLVLLFGAFSFLRLRRTVRVSLPYRERIYFCDAVDSPFILGFFRPRIYLPSSLDTAQLSYVLAHETAHIRRRDHLWKPIGYLLLAVYWFNPVLWLAYILLCRDIEKACDEKVVADMDKEHKRGYSEALLSCSANRRTIAVCPLAFGEVGVKSRVKGVLNYKKPAFWIILISLLLVLATAVCLLTVPFGEDETPKTSDVEEAMKAAVGRFTENTNYPLTGALHGTEEAARALMLTDVLMDDFAESELRSPTVAGPFILQIKEYVGDGIVTSNFKAEIVYDYTGSGLEGTEITLALRGTQRATVYALPACGTLLPAYLKKSLLPGARNVGAYELYDENGYATVEMQGNTLYVVSENTAFFDGIETVLTEEEKQSVFRSENRYEDGAVVLLDEYVNALLERRKAHDENPFARENFFDTEKTSKAKDAHTDLIKQRMSYKEVVALLGAPHEEKSQTKLTNALALVWETDNYARFTVTFDCTRASSFDYDEQYEMLAECGVVNKTEYEAFGAPVAKEDVFDAAVSAMPSEEEAQQITQGMSYSDAVSILGKPHGDLSSLADPRVLKWNVKDGKPLFITFRFSESLPQMMLQENFYYALTAYGEVSSVHRDENDFTIKSYPYDEQTLDLDGDGDMERCVLMHGTTSGLFTIAFNAWDAETDHIEYSGMFLMEFYRDFKLFKDESGVGFYALSGAVKHIYRFFIGDEGVGIELAEENYGDYHAYERVATKEGDGFSKERALTEQEKTMLSAVLSSVTWNPNTSYDAEGNPQIFNGELTHAFSGDGTTIHFYQYYNSFDRKMHGALYDHEHHMSTSIPESLVAMLSDAFD